MDTISFISSFAALQCLFRDKLPSVNGCAALNNMSPSLGWSLSVALLPFKGGLGVVLAPSGTAEGTLGFSYRIWLLPLGSWMKEKPPLFLKIFAHTKGHIEHILLPSVLGFWCYSRWSCSTMLIFPQVLKLIVENPTAVFPISKTDI